MHHCSNIFKQIQSSARKRFSCSECKLTPSPQPTPAKLETTTHQPLQHIVFQHLFFSTYSQFQTLVFCTSSCKSQGSEREEKVAANRMENTAVIHHFCYSSTRQGTWTTHKTEWVQFTALNNIQLSSKSNCCCALMVDVRPAFQDQSRFGSSGGT